MRILGFSLIVFFLSNSLQSQTLDWGKVTAENGSLIEHFSDNDGNGYFIYEYSDSINPDPDGFEFVEGIPMGRNILLQKTASNGSLLWTCNWLSTDLGMPALNFNDMAFDGDDYIYFSGYFSNEIDIDPGETEQIITPSGGYDIFVLKMSTSGEFLWCKTFGGEQTDFGANIALTSENELLIFGKFQGEIDFEPLDGIPAFVSDLYGSFFLLKLNDEGDHLWSKSFGASNGAKAPVKMKLNEEGEIWCAVNFTNALEVDPNLDEDVIISSEGNYDIALIHFDNEANLLAHYHYSGEMNEEIIDFEVFGDGDLAVLGSFSSPVADLNPTALEDNYTWGGGPVHPNYFIQRLSPIGVVDWTITFDEASLGLYPADLEIGLNDGIYLLGDFWKVIDVDLSTDEFLLEPVGSNPLDWDVFLITFNGDGTFLSALNFSQDGFERAREIKEDNEGDLYISLYNDGLYFDADPTVGTYPIIGEYENMYVLLKFSPIYFLGNKTEQSQNDVTTYPNPSKGMLWISTNQEWNNGSLEIFTTDGKLVHSEIWNEGVSNQVYTDLSSGTYILKLKSNDQEIVEKIIIQN